jgi:hypothetical protein
MNRCFARIPAAEMARLDLKPLNLRTDIRKASWGQLAPPPITFSALVLRPNQAHVVAGVRPIMKTRLLWTLILAVAAPALYFGITRPHVSSIPRNLRDPIDELKPAAMPPLDPPALVIPELPAFTIPPLPNIRPSMPIAPAADRPEVPIQDQATIDFSTGAPVVRRHGKDQEALEAALKEMSEVIKDAKIEVNKK